MNTAPDLSSVAPFGLEAFEEALELLHVFRDGAGIAVARRSRSGSGADWLPISDFGAEWLFHAGRHLARRFEGELRQTPAVSSEAEALALLRGLALELKHAGDGLLRAAGVLRVVGGRGADANLTYRQGRKALELAAPYLE